MRWRASRIMRLQQYQNCCGDARVGGEEGGTQQMCESFRSVRHPRIRARDGDSPRLGRAASSQTEHSRFPGYLTWKLAGSRERLWRISSTAISQLYTRVVPCKLSCVFGFAWASWVYW